MFSFVFLSVICLSLFSELPCAYADSRINNLQSNSEKKITHRRHRRQPGMFIEKKTDSKQICVINAQSILSATQISLLLKEFIPVFHFPIVLKEMGNQPPQKLAEDLLSDNGIGAVLVLTQDKTSPTLLLAPEDGWVAINIGRLSKGADSAKLIVRSRKEFWRAFCYLMGAANSNYPECVMKTVRNLEDLDKLRMQVACPEPFNKIMQHAQNIGIKPKQIVSYATAIREGWAPAPTNDVQRAIWRRVKDSK